MKETALARRMTPARRAIGPRESTPMEPNEEYTSVDKADAPCGDPQATPVQAYLGRKVSAYRNKDVIDGGSTITIGEFLEHVFAGTWSDQVAKVREERALVVQAWGSWEEASLAAGIPPGIKPKNWTIS